MNKSKGFTIIELIVVIAIIAVLAAIVLVNVTQYIAKGKNAAIQGNMSTLLTNGATYFDANSGNYGYAFAANVATGCGATGPIALAIDSANGSADTTAGSYGVPLCVGDTASQAWCGTTKTLAAGSTVASTFCVDSTGYKGVLGSGKCTTGVFTCQ